MNFKSTLCFVYLTIGGLLFNCVNAAYYSYRYTSKCYQCTYCPDVFSQWDNRVREQTCGPNQVCLKRVSTALGQTTTVRECYPMSYCVPGTEVYGSSSISTYCCDRDVCNYANQLNKFNIKLFTIVLMTIFVLVF